MYGAIIGDLAGSIYEFDQVMNIHPVYINEIINDNSFYSDDTILTVAILDAILHNGNYLEYLKKYAYDYLLYKPDFKPYFKTTFSPGFIKWVNGKSDGNSVGNGAMMRISPVGYMFDNEKDIIDNARLVTMTSHNSIEAINCATKIALIIFYLREGLTIEEVYNKLNIITRYEPFKKFNTTCNDTIDNCLYVLYNSVSFNDAIRKTILMGGDTDTNAAIVGSMAEALYGAPNDLLLLVKKKIPCEFVDTLENGYKRMKKLSI